MEFEISVSNFHCCVEIELICVLTLSPVTLLNSFINCMRFLFWFDFLQILQD